MFYYAYRVVCTSTSKTKQLYNNEPNRADCGYQVQDTERKISHLLYMDDLKLLGRNENDSKNEMKVVQTISKDINMNFGLEKCAIICLKRGSVQRKCI